MYKKKDVILTGFALFAMLFGAGNLIFPPVVGFTNGDNWIVSAIGFILTGAGFPLLAIIAAAVAGKDLDSFATRVSPLFSKIFNIALILSIGPLLALPRTGATAFEMMVPQNIENFQIYKFGFLTIFFAVTILFSLKSSKVVDRVGAILTPILLIVLAIIIFKGVFSPIGEPKIMGAATPFKYGFLNGYQTMDTLAAIVFSEIILKSIRKGRNISEKAEFSFLIKASFIAIGGLTIVYGGLVYIGGTATLSSEEVMAEAMRSFTFDESNKLAWPVLGHITLDYSMDETVLFKSLGVYKCSPGIIINSEVGTNVAAAASGVVTDVAELSETGTTVTVSIGNGYETTTGMIENVNLKKGDKVTTGQLIGTVASPSAYYIEEGPGVYFKLTQYGEPVNPDAYFVE